jgi:hypothetical protein
MYEGLYKVDSDKSKGFLSELVVLMNFGAITEVEIFTCYNCGRRGLDKEFYELANVESASWFHPGYPGDYICGSGSCF